MDAAILGVLELFVDRFFGLLNLGFQFEDDRELSAMAGDSCSTWIA